MKINPILAIDSNFVTTGSVTPEQEATGELKVLYHNGMLLLEDNFETIRTSSKSTRTLRRVC